jgi:allantoate deiminase
MIDAVDETMRAAYQVAERCDALATISSMSGGITRVYLSDEHRRANELVGSWMSEAGLIVRQDAAGNLRGRTAPPEDSRPTLVLGSHLDTVVDAGRFDGIVGVLMAIAVVTALCDRLEQLPVALEVIGFSDEEGTRFGKALMGSSAVAGIWDPEWWELTDSDGVTVRRAFLDFGLDPAAIGEASLAASSLAGYLEAHIEQGPFLDRAGKALGIVTGIAGARRFEVTVTGEARHAGGTPYPSRRDALLGAAEAALAVERICRAENQIGTVGTLQVEPGAVNIVPGFARFTIDLRGERDEGRDRAWVEICAALEMISRERGVRFAVAELHTASAVRCSANLRAAIAEGIRVTGEDSPPELFSPAGHDAMAMANLTDAGMLFLRNPDGISHHPDEYVSAEDIAAGLTAMTQAVLRVPTAQGLRAAAR